MNLPTVSLSTSPKGPKLKGPRARRGVQSSRVQGPTGQMAPRCKGPRVHWAAGPNGARSPRQPSPLPFFSQADCTSATLAIPSPAIVLLLQPLARLLPLSFEMAHLRGEPLGFALGFRFAFHVKFFTGRRSRSDSILLQFRCLPQKRRHSAPPAIFRHVPGNGPIPFKAPPPHSSMATYPRIRPMATLGFCRLPVFNAVSGSHMTRPVATSSVVEPVPAYVNVDITHTAGDVELRLREMFSNPRLTLIAPRPADESMPIRALTNERQGLLIYLPQPSSEASPPEIVNAWSKWRADNPMRGNEGV